MNMGIILVVAVLGLWALGVFFGLVGGVSKTFTKPAAMDSSKIKEQAQQTIDQTNQKQQQLMDDIQDKIRDQSSQKF